MNFLKMLGISGKSIEKRKSLQDLLKRLDEFDIVLVWKLSRLSRSVRDFSNMLYDFEKHNVSFISYSENINTSQASGKLLIYVISIISEIERDNISENVKLAKQKQFEDRKITACNVLGYDIIDNNLVVNPKEKEIVQFIFTKYAELKSYYAVANLCNKNGYKGKNGKWFYPTSIKKILQNKIYIGYNNHLNESIKSSHKAIIDYKLFKEVNV